MPQALPASGTGVLQFHLALGYFCCLLSTTDTYVLARGDSDMAAICKTQSRIYVASWTGACCPLYWLLSNTTCIAVRMVQDMARGSLSTVRQGIQRAKSDLLAKEFRNIDAKYRAQLLELKTAEMAASDLNEYHKVQCDRRIL